MTFYDGQDSSSNFVLSFNRNPGADFGVYAKGYRLAADRLAKQLVDASRFGDYEAYPICFLYRHALELSLKQIISESVLLTALTLREDLSQRLKCIHILDSLAETAQKVLTTCFPEDAELRMLMSKVSWTCKELSSLDPKSESFRYPVNVKGQATSKHHQIVNLEAFSNHLSSVLEDLDAVHFGLDIETSKAEECYEILQEMLIRPLNSEDLQ